MNGRNKMRTFILLLGIVLLVSISTAQNYKQYLFAYWSFDDSTAKDFSGHGYHGTIMHNPTPVPGVYNRGTAFHFVGRGDYSPMPQVPEGDHIIVPRIPLENYPEFTCELWVKDESMSYYYGDFYLYFGFHDKGWLGIGNHTLQKFVGDTVLYSLFSVGANNVDIDPLNQLFDLKLRNQWVHYCFTYENKIITAYINGKRIGTKKQDIKIGGNTAGIACHWWTYGDDRSSARFTGVIDEVKIFTKALSDSDIVNEYKGFKITSRTNSICEGDTLTLFADPGYNNYNWSTGEKSQKIVVTQRGTYSITANFNKVIYKAEFTVDFLPKPNPVITMETQPCKGRKGKLSLSGHYASWRWSNGETTSSISVPTPGKYSVTVVDYNGCTGTKEIVVDESLPGKFNLQLLGNPFYCIGDTVEIKAISGLFNLEWFEENEGKLTNQTGSSIRVTKSGLYYAKGQSADSCESLSDSIRVKFNPLPVPEINVLLQPCNGRPGKLSLTGDYLFWRWSTGETASTISAPTAGKYSVSVVDSNGCNGSTEIMVKENYVYVTVTGKIPICLGDTVTLNAETGFVTYQWYLNNTEILSEKKRNIKVTKAGQYYVRAITSDSCIAVSDLFDVYFFPQPLPSINVLRQPCKGRTGILSLNGKFSSVRWSTNETSSSISVPQPGKYSVIVIDSNGCTGYSEMIVDEVIPEKINVSITGKIAKCNADSVELTADSTFLNYEWYENSSGKLPNEVQPKIKVAKSGKYFVKGMTKDSCLTSSDLIDVTVEPSIDVLSFDGFANDTIIDFDSVNYGNLACKKLRIRNNSSSDYALKSINLKYNTNFSVPQSQFTLVIPALDFRELTVCTSPLATGALWDSLFIQDICSEHPVKLKVFGLTNDYLGNSSCSVMLSFKTLKLPFKQGLNIGEPYPNPSIVKLNIPYSLKQDKDKNPDINISLYSVFNKNSPNYEKIILSSTDENNIHLETGEFTIDISDFPTGTYLLNISQSGDNFSFPVVIIR